MITRDEVLGRAADGGDRIPMLTLAEFFDGNDVEDSIAPNQYGYGRPDLAEIAARPRALEADDAVAWVRVQLHEEMFEDGYDDVGRPLLRPGRVLRRAGRAGRAPRADARLGLSGGRRG